MKIYLGNNKKFKWTKVDNIYAIGYIIEENNIKKDEELIKYFYNAIEKNRIEKCLNEIDGRFTVIIEEDENIKILSDILRSFPVFYKKLENEIIISDDLEIFKNITLKKESVIEILSTGYVTGKDTLYDNVYQNEASKIISINKKSFEINEKKYFVFKQDDVTLNISKEEICKELDKKYDNAIKQLIKYAKGRRIILPLSGGHDSRVIAYYLKKNNYNNVLTYTYGRKNNIEAEVSKKVAEYLGYEWNFVEYKTKSMQIIKAGKVNAVIVKDLSRLGRNYIEVGNYIEQIFPLYNIRFIALNDNIDSYKDPRSVNNVIVPFKNLMNDEYCRDISNKVKSVINAKKRRGEFCAGIAPYGYVKDPEDKHHLIIDEESAKVVRLIFKKTLEGIGRLIIARELNQMGILGPNDYKRLVLKIKCGNGINNSKTNGVIGWNVGQISKMLKNEVYCGDMIQCRHKKVSYKVHKIVANDKKDWIIVRNTHEAIISREDFNKVQDIILSRDNRVTNFGVLTLFSGFLRCNDCHRGMTRKRGGQKHDGSGEYNYVYYCNTYTRKSQDLCSMHKIRCDKLEELVLKTIRIQAKLILNIEETIKEISKSKKINYNKDILIQSIKKLEVELAKKKALKKSVYEDWKLDIISKDEYLEYVSEYEDDIKKLQDNIEELNKKSTLYNQDKKEDNKWIEVFRKNQDITKLTREILSELINVIYIHEGENITIEFKYENEYKQALKFLKENKEYIEKIKGNQILMEKIQSVQKFLESSDAAV